MQLLFATSNPHKLEEVRAILDSPQLAIIGLCDLPQRPEEPIEDGATFLDNARKKAMHYARATGRLCLADDSGLEVDALDGEPGVYSARYAGIGETRAKRDQANNAKLLGRLNGIPHDQRTARFVCCMCLVDPRGRVLAETRGTFGGIIAREPRGESGFGYDPLLWLPDQQCTVAELSAEQKNARSHRGGAARAMAERLRRLTSPQAPPPPT